MTAGEFCYIKGCLFYTNKHPAGVVAGFNVVCIGKNDKGEDLFLGFGPNTFKKPLIEKEFFEVFAHYYNLDRNEFDWKAAKNKDFFILKKFQLKIYYNAKAFFLLL